MDAETTVRRQNVATVSSTTVKLVTMETWTTTIRAETIAV